jgi:hypothetical protein
MDAFSEILSGVKLNGAVFFTAEFSAPWGFSASGSKVMAATIAPGTAHLILYHKEPHCHFAITGLTPKSRRAI